MSLLLFYDYPTPPAGIFDDFLAIPYFTKDVKTRSFIDLVKAAPANATGGTRSVSHESLLPRLSCSLTHVFLRCRRRCRTVFHTVSLLDYTPAVMDAVLNETKVRMLHLMMPSGIVRQSHAYGRV